MEAQASPQEHHTGSLSDATVLNGSIYAIGLETYVGAFNVQWVGNTSLFKIGPNGKPLEKYIISGGFCDEETWPSLGVESYDNEVIAYGVSCVPRFRNKTSWVVALDEDGRYRWGLSLPGYISRARVWNGSIVVATTYTEENTAAQVMLWINPLTGKIERAYSIPLADIHAILTFKIDKDGKIIAAGYDEKMLSWAGIIYPNGTIRLWDTGIEAWDGPSVWAVGNESRFLIAVGWSNGTYLVNPTTGSALFAEGIYPYAFAVMNGSPTMVAYRSGGKSILVRLNWNGSIESASFLANFTVLFVEDGLMGGYSGKYYSIASFQPSQGKPVSLQTFSVKPMIKEVVSSLRPINVTVRPFKPLIITQNFHEKRAALKVVTIPQGAEVYINGTYTGKTPLSLNLAPGNYTIELTKESYKNRTLSLALSSKGENITVELEPLPGRLSVTSNPGGAEVYVDGNYAGETPSTSRFQRENTRSGSHSGITRPTPPQLKSGQG